MRGRRTVRDAEKAEILAARSFGGAERFIRLAKSLGQRTSRETIATELKPCSQALGLRIRRRPFAERPDFVGARSINGVDGSHATKRW